MLHLTISLLSYLVFFLVKMLTPAQQASWRIQPTRGEISDKTSR